MIYENRIYVAQARLDLKTSCLHLSSTGITDVYHSGQVYVFLGKNNIWIVPYI